MARHSQHDIVEAVQRLSAAAAIASEDLVALENGSASLETLNQDRPLSEVEMSPLAHAELDPSHSDARPGSLAA